MREIEPDPTGIGRSSGMQTRLPFCHLLISTCNRQSMARIQDLDAKSIEHAHQRVFAQHWEFCVEFNKSHPTVKYPTAPWSLWIQKSYCSFGEGHLDWWVCESITFPGVSYPYSPITCLRKRLKFRIITTPTWLLLQYCYNG